MRGGERKLITYGEDEHGDGIDDGIDGGVADGDGDVVDGDVDVNVMEGGLTSLGSEALSLLSEPHDQPYPTHSYATKLLQSCSLTNSDTHPLQASEGPHRGRRHGK